MPPPFWIHRDSTLQNPQPARLEADHGYGVVFDLHEWMVDVAPIAEDLFGWAHQPQQKVDIVRCLIHQYTATFGVPSAAPGVPAVVRLITPHLAEGFTEDNVRPEFALIERLT